MWVCMHISFNSICPIFVLKNYVCAPCIHVYLPVGPKIKGFSVCVFSVHHTEVTISFGHRLNRISHYVIYILTCDWVIYCSTQFTIGLPSEFKKWKE